MSNLSLLDVQKALYAKLAADNALMAMVSGVFDRVKDGTDYPYVVLSDAVAEDVSTQTQIVQRVVVALEVFSRGGGRKQALEIAARVNNLLHEGTMSISNQSVINMRVEQVRSEKLADGMTYLASVRVVVWVQNN